MTLLSNWTFFTTVNNVCVMNMDATLRADTRTASMLACTRIIWERARTMHKRLSDELFFVSRVSIFYWSIIS
jgi:hypothetical protein